MIQMSHPKIPHTAKAPVTVSQREFDTLYKERGWKVHKATKKAEA